MNNLQTAAHSSILSSAFLATRAEKSAPRRLHNPADGRTALDARLAGAVVNQQPLGEKIPRARRAAVIKQAVRLVRAEIQRNRAATINRRLQHFADAVQ